MRRRRPPWVEVATPLGGAVLTCGLLAVVNRLPALTSTFVGWSAQWLLTMLCMGGLIAAGVALGRSWARATRFRAAARAAPLSLAISAASLVLFAQTCSPRESEASGYVGLATIGALAVAIPAAIVAAAGTHAVEHPEPEPPTRA